MAKVILFDHDDTLVQTIQAKWAQHKYIAKKFYGITLTDAEIKSHWGKPLTVLIKLLYGTDHIDIAMSYNIATRKKFPKRRFPDTIETLQALRDRGIFVGVVTATTRSSLEHDWKTLQIGKELFDYIQTEDDTAVHKPDPRVFLPALEWLEERNISARDVIYVGDSLNDMKAAEGAGFQPIGITTGLVPTQEFEQHRIRSVSTLSELLAITDS
jgi:HAD superfamily hydrolase (TIGR01549 family)